MELNQPNLADIRSKCLSGQTDTTLTHGAGVCSAAAAADSVTVDPPKKKLKILAAMEPVQPASTSTDDYSHVIAQEVTAYLSPLRLTDTHRHLCRLIITCLAVVMTLRVAFSQSIKSIYCVKDSNNHTQ